MTDKMSLEDSLDYRFTDVHFTATFQLGAEVMHHMHRLPPDAILKP